MKLLTALAWALVVFALLAGFIANPPVLVAMAALYWLIYKTGTWLTRKRDAGDSRREKWTGL